MGAGHVHPLYRPGDSAVHLLPPQVKIVAALLAVLAVVATPREVPPAFAAQLLVLLAIWRIAGIPTRWFATRAVIELPFVVLAVLLPFAGGTPRVPVLGLSLSVGGLYAAFNILAKGTLGVLVSLTLAGTTPLRDLVLGLQRLRAPAIVTTIATLMLRYLDVIAGEARRMRLARLSRGHDPRFLVQAGATARGLGSLFIRSYQRGERVHLAMLSRGWTGVLPGSGHAASTVQWLAALAPAALMTLVAAAAWWVR
ncbi:MAG TPA: cobalt ECF transporter T component CbiQ [Pseudonocardiaceae bacterium]